VAGAVVSDVLFVLVVLGFFVLLALLGKGLDRL
jgi:hypothetical protein